MRRIEALSGPAAIEALRERDRALGEIAGALRTTPEQAPAGDLAGDPIESIVTKAPSNGAPLGGLKVSTKRGWFAARPSGTEDVYKIYAESFAGEDHLKRIQEEAQRLVESTVL